MTVIAQAPLGPSRALAHFSSGLAFDAIPSGTVERLKLCLLDGLSCAIYATGLPWSRILTDFVQEMGGVAEAGVWGTPLKVPAANAVLVNGTLVHGFELDDLHKASILHPSAAAVPAALAIVERAGTLSGRDLLTAMAAGFEVGIRAGLSLGTSHLVNGFHPTGTNGAVAAAAAAGRALELSTRQMEHAIGIAATQAAGLMSAQYESMVKRMHAGRAAQAGVVGALLAQRGFTGIDRVFEADYGGYCSTLSSDSRLDLITEGLGDRFEASKVGFKTYACCGSCHTSVEAIRHIRSSSAIGAGDVERVVVHTTRATLLHVGWPYQPRSITAAQMNLPYCVAVTLVDGNAFVEQFTEQRIRDPELVRLAGLVEVRHEPEFDSLGAGGRHTVRVEIELRNGERYAETVHHAKGSDADPLSDDEVLEKHRRLVVPVLGSQRSQQLLDTVMSLDAARSTDVLSELLGATPG